MRFSLIQNALPVTFILMPSTDLISMDFFPDTDHFLHLHEIPGKDLILDIAGIHFAVSGLSGHVFSEALARYDLFLNDGSPDHRLLVFPGSSSYLQPNEKYLRFVTRFTEKGEILVSTDFAAIRWHNPALPGILRYRTPLQTNLILAAVENYLRWAAAHHLLSLNAFLLHATGIVVNHRAYIFFGHSGAGKSTIAALSPQSCGILSDDLVILQKRNQTWEAVTTPFWGTLPQTIKVKGRYPVEGIYQLIKSQNTERIPISGAPAIARLMSCCPFVGHQLRCNVLLPLLQDLSHSIAVYDLYFKKEPTFWNIVLDHDSK